jgi:TldD protein
VLDDGTIADRRGSLNVDDEGNASQRNADRRRHFERLHPGFAQRALRKVKLTGNGRSYACADAAHDQHLHAGGNKASEEVVASIVLALRHHLMQDRHHIGRSLSSASEAYRRERQILYPVKGATIVGNGPDSLTRVT